MALRRPKKGGGTNFFGTETGQNFCSVVAEERRYTGVFQVTKYRQAEILPVSARRGSTLASLGFYILDVAARIIGIYSGAVLRIIDPGELPRLVVRIGNVPGFGDIPVFIVAVDNEVFIPRAATVLGRISYIILTQNSRETAAPRAKLPA